MEQKIELFQEMENYKEILKVRKEKPSFYMNDYMPPEAKDAQRREREIFRENEKDQTSQVNMTFNRAKLYVEGERYQNSIKPPHSTAILASEDNEIEEICATEIPSGKPIETQGSVFKGYVLPAKTIQEINKAYMKLRLMFPHARHILCSYTIPGLPRCLYEGYCEDKEIGSGRVMLDILKQSQLQCVAIFVVRIHNGPNIGAERFDLIEKVVINAIHTHPRNKYTRQNMAAALEQRQATKEQKSRGSHGGGSKYGVGRGGRYQPPSLRGNRSGKTNPRPSMTNDRENLNMKKRRTASPPENNSWDAPFQFSDPAICNFGQGPVMGSELGGSWPTLAQSVQK